LKFYVSVPIYSWTFTGNPLATADSYYKTILSQNMLPVNVDMS